MTGSRRPRVALVNPSHSLTERYGAMRSVRNKMPALGLLGLAAVLREARFDVAVVDASSRDLGYADTLRELDAFMPDAVGMTVFTPSIFNVVKTAELLKASRP